MRLNKVLGALLAGSVALTPVAASAAQPVGSILSVNGDAYVSREGRLLRAQPSMAINAGDRVITRTGSTAKLGLNGCSTSVSGGEMKTVSGASCGSVQTASFERAAAQTRNSSQLAGFGGTGIIVGILALAAIAAGIVAATSGHSHPSSP